MTPAAKTYFSLWLLLDDLWKAGKGETDEADELRDRMETPWYDLDENARREVEENILRHERT